MALFCRTERRWNLIPVTQQPEPASFEATVRRRGKAFLVRFPPPKKPTADQFRKHQYWRDVLPELRSSYREICAYCACWIPFDQGSVDHFEPKSSSPTLAYEWANYRLAQEKLNNNKGNSTDVLDPFHIQPGWFVLDAATFFVKANGGLPQDVTDAVNRTIATLQLNSNSLVKLRYTVLKEYSDGHWDFDFMERRYPFIAAELARQNLVAAILGTIK
jgi:uncharacterized protein (TIGR02646 family)